MIVWVVKGAGKCDTGRGTRTRNADSPRSDKIALEEHGMARSLAVITGASSGIGAVFAKKLAAEHDLLLIARRKDRLEALAAELRTQSGAAVDVLAAGLADEQGLALAAERVGAAANLGLLVNNAGFGAGGLFWEADLTRQEEIHRLHVMAVVRLCHAALKNMVPRNAGGIINVASVAAFVRRPGSTSYGATKSWMTVFTEGLWLELQAAKSAVKIQALCPGFTYSEFHEVAQLDRGKLAPRSFWLDAEFVVDESLKGLRRGKLYVIPDWKYKAIAALLTKLPVSARLAIESKR